MGNVTDINAFKSKVQKEAVHKVVDMAEDYYTRGGIDCCNLMRKGLGATGTAGLKVMTIQQCIDLVNTLEAILKDIPATKK